MVLPAAARRMLQCLPAGGYPLPPQVPTAAIHASGLLTHRCDAMASALRLQLRLQLGHPLCSMAGEAEGGLPIMLACVSPHTHSTADTAAARNWNPRKDFVAVARRAKQNGAMAWPPDGGALAPFEAPLPMTALTLSKIVVIMGNWRWACKCGPHGDRVSGTATRPVALRQATIDRQFNRMRREMPQFRGKLFRALLGN